MASILIADDQTTMRLTLTLLLKQHGHQVTQAQTGDEALSKVNSEIFDLVVTDLKMDNVSGIDVLKGAKKVAPNMEVIVLTGYGTVESAVEAMKLGAFDYIIKPFEPDELLLQIDKALERQKLRAEVARLRQEVDARFGSENIVAHSKEMNKVLELARRVGPTDATVLIQGESGTGKELIARAIHQCSLRRDQAFIPVNCAALPETLLESELFGHVKGAFTGAMTSKKGMFEEAHQGTLFLDEIGEMSPATQVKLLRVLQNGEIRHVGSNTPVTVDVRVLAATNKRLEDAVREKTFREDLYYRLQVVPIVIPPLREHPDDILPLAEHFLQHFTRKFQMPAKNISREVRQTLIEYPWPGNVRELENAMERATILSRGDQLGIDDLDLGDAVMHPASSDHDVPLAEIERQHIESTMRRHNGDMDASARSLGISAGSLQRKMRQLKIDT